MYSESILLDKIKDMALTVLNKSAKLSSHLLQELIIVV